MKIFVSISLLFIGHLLFSQNAKDYFVASASAYVNSKNDEALTIVNQGLTKFPEDSKLTELKKKLEQQKQEQQKNKQDEGKNKDENQKQKDKDQSQQKSKQENGKNQGQEGSGNSPEDVKNQKGEADNEFENSGIDWDKKRKENLLKALESEEKKTQRRLLMNDSKSKMASKQKDW